MYFNCQRNIYYTTDTDNTTEQVTKIELEKQIRFDRDSNHNDFPDASAVLYQLRELSSQLGAGRIAVSL